jgi:MarR family 2-MHQ and catechol resistance regulon transcriptional repressor
MPTHYNGSPQEKLALNTFIKLTRSVEALSNRLAQRGALGELTPSQFGVLEVLYHLGPMCQYQLAAKILKSSGNMTMVIDNLEKHGLVQRQRSATDRRMVTVHLTEAGREKIALVLPEQVAAITAELGALTPQEQDTLGELCRKLGKPEPGGSTSLALPQAEEQPA